MLKNKGQSIYQYLLKRIIGIVIISAIVMMTSSIYYLNHETEEVFDASLIQTSFLVKALLPPQLNIGSFAIPKDLRFSQFVNSDSFNATSGEEEDNEKVNKYENDLAIIVQDKQLKVLFSTIDSAVELNLIHEGFDYFTIAGEEWRVLSLFDKDRKVWISSLHKREVRDELNLYMIYSILPPIIVSTLLLLMATLVAIKKGLLPLKRISHDLISRDPDNLTAISEHMMPSEVRQIVTALNTMFAKVDTTLTRERRFTDDAAHELRTPLTGMHLQLNLLENSEAKKMLGLGVERMIRLVNQLLQLVRLEPSQSDLITTQSCDLKQILAGSIADSYPLAMQKNIEIELIADTSVSIKGNSILIEVLVRNLLENAIHYSMTSNIEVILKAQERIHILIVDHGKGLSDMDKKNVSRRFYRVNKNDGLGSGLGLSIVDNIVELHQWECNMLDTKHGGLTVEITLDNKKY
ncbi:MAG: ATP-binding protein [Oceanospirillaceae bacterium]